MGFSSLWDKYAPFPPEDPKKAQDKTPGPAAGQDAPAEPKSPEEPHTPGGQDIPDNDLPPMQDLFGHVHGVVPEKYTNGDPQGTPEGPGRKARKKAEPSPEPEPEPKPKPKRSRSVMEELRNAAQEQEEQDSNPLVDSDGFHLSMPGMYGVHKGGSGEEAGAQKRKKQGQGRGKNSPKEPVHREKRHVSMPRPNFSRLGELPWLDIICIAITVIGLILIAVNFDVVTAAIFSFLYPILCNGFSILILVALAVAAYFWFFRRGRGRWRW